MTETLVGGLDLHKLRSFLVSYFGDYWEGKSEKDILDEALLENEKGYLVGILEQLTALIQLDVPIAIKREFLLGANIYMDSDEKTSTWLDLIHVYLEKELKP